MKKIIVLFFVCLLVASCSSTNPYDVQDGEGVYLKNREEYKGKAKFIYEFYSAITSAGKKDFGDARDFISGRYTTNKITSGAMTLGLKIYYYPEGSYNDLSIWEKLKFSDDLLMLDTERFNRLRNPYLIWVFNQKEKVSGLEGIKLHALDGHTYQINCKIEDGKAYVWIEDNNGDMASEVVRGFGKSYENQWFWVNLPQPAP